MWYFSPQMITSKSAILTRQSLTTVWRMLSMASGGSTKPVCQNITSNLSIRFTQVTWKLSVAFLVLGSAWHWETLRSLAGKSAKLSNFPAIWTNTRFEAYLIIYHISWFNWLVKVDNKLSRFSHLIIFFRSSKSSNCNKNYYFLWN